jgi:signal transduction histidine kinase
MFSALFVAAYANVSDSVAVRLAVMLATALGGVGLSMLIVLFASRMILAPLDELKDAMGRVRAGDYSTPVPVVSSDDLGDLAQTFNSMLAGLRERENMREELRASRARIVTAADAERKRIERNIHDGAQQQLVGLALKLRLLEDRVDDADLRSSMAALQDRLKITLDELRELARGLHPSVLSTDGLQPALAHLAEHAAVPVEVHAPERRFPEMVESTAYYVASEALANVAKYAEASRARVHVNADNGSVVITVTDDGIGGAHAEPRSGLAGLKDRVEAVDGRLTIISPAGQGTRLVAELPLS